MQKFTGFDTAIATTYNEKLPAGNYVLKILKAEEVVLGNNGRGLKISFDINEGEYKGFFQKKYVNQRVEEQKWKGIFMAYVPNGNGDESDNDKWTANAFKTAITAIEDSNNGYRWDWNEQCLKGKLVGGVFGNKEYAFNGKQGFYTDCRYLTSIDNVLNGNIKQPKDKLLKRPQQSQPFDTSEFFEIDTNLPF